MTTSTHDDVVELVGDLDDLIIERIVETGASPAEVARALAELADDDDDRFDDHLLATEPHLGAAARVASVRAILAELTEVRDAPDEDFDDARTPVGG